MSESDKPFRDIPSGKRQDAQAHARQLFELFQDGDRVDGQQGAISIQNARAARQNPLQGTLHVNALQPFLRCAVKRRHILMFGFKGNRVLPGVGHGFNRFGKPPFPRGNQERPFRGITLDLPSPILLDKSRIVA